MSTANHPAHVLQMTLTEEEFLLLHAQLAVIITRRGSSLTDMLTSIMLSEEIIDSFNVEQLNVLTDKFNHGIEALDCGDPDCPNHQLARRKDAEG